MEKSEAEELFHEADRLYREERYEQALAIIDRLNVAFPDKHRLLYPKARCLAHLGRIEEATEICEHLLEDFHDDRAVELREQLERYEETLEFDYKFDSKFSDPHFGRSTPSVGVPASDRPDAIDGEDGRAGESWAEAEPESKEFRANKPRIKPVRLTLAFGLVAAAAAGFIPWWAAAVPIAAYLLVKLLVRWAMYRLFTVPFRMKGKALSGASVKVHTVQPSTPPSDYDSDDEGAAGNDLKWYEVVATISPQERSQGFTRWEPGELALLPAAKKLQKLDDHESAYSVAGVEIFEENRSMEDEGFKIEGSCQIKFRVAVPPNAGPFRLVYYFETLEGDVVSL